MKKFLFTVFSFLLSTPLWATHNRAGEITYKYLGNYTIEATVVTYTRFDPNNPNLASNQADRPNITIAWGDGNMDTIPRINGLNNSGEMVDDEIKMNVYRGTYQYSGPGSYTLSVEDPNRNERIANLPEPSDQIPFYIEATLILSAFLGANSSPDLLNPPIDDACAGKKFIHNPAAYDPDGDSLSYTLVNVKGTGGNDIAGYWIPDNVTLSQDGDLVWNVPTQQGVFNFAILIEEWRGPAGSKVKIGSVLRDMQVTVEGDCSNNPPVIRVTEDTCVLANTLLEVPVNVTDPDSNNANLIAYGEPFEITNSPASFGPFGYTPVPFTKNFTWQTTCSHVRVNPYKVLFKSEDFHSTNPLADMKTLNIKVVGPAPKNPQATPQGNSIILNWEVSECPQVTKYLIYRRSGRYNYTPANCELGVPAYTGYSLIATVQGLSTITYTDNSGLVHGNEYCYMIVAVYPDGAESYASVEVCAELIKDVPIITNVTVLQTATAGKDSLAWSKPTELNLVQNPGPYRYLIYRSADMNGSNFTLIDSTTLNTTLDDTTYVDNNVNTQAGASSYRVDLWNYTPGSAPYLIGSTHTASSIFLTLTPSDNELTLAWNFNVPWSNTEYIIYRKNNTTGMFDSIAATTEQSYRDINLVNGATYCYLIKSIGSYSTTGIVNPIINLSQEACGVPVDLIPPCGPDLMLVPDCEIPQNTLTWNNPNNSCADDVVQYNIYYKPSLKDPFQLIKTITGAKDTTFIHVNEGSIAGCYYVTAIDSFMNESVERDSFCVDNCPVYELPNVFTPDGDGKNDYFRPFPYRFIKSVDIKLFNRWGQVIFETTDPDIMWNGVNQFSNKPSPEGVYYYAGTVNEIRLEGIVPRQVGGFFHIFRSSGDIPPTISE